MMRWFLLALAATVSLPARAQITGPVRNGEESITVTNTRPGDARVEMSDWHIAETPHVIVFGEDEKAAVDTAHDLEKLHFLLSTLHGRVDAPDDTIKIAVTMIGDVATFEQLRLTDLRWQYGPFPSVFAKAVYYDPREEGSVLATTSNDQNLVLQPSNGRASSRNCDPDTDSPAWQNFPVVRATNPENPADITEYLSQFRQNEIVICQTARSRLYSGFAQNYLMTYLPAAYPRWFVQGFGELFGTLVTGEDYVEYGQRPDGYFKVLARYGTYPVKDVLNERYLSGKGFAWTPYHAWNLVHFFYFSDEWKPRLRRYLAVVAAGGDPAKAADALGDPRAIQRAALIHRGTKAPFDRLTFPADRAPAPTVRRLTRAEAGLIRGRLELGARIEVPEDAGREQAVTRRTAWLDRLRDNAARYPALIEHQLLLAEAECRSGNAEPCLAAADRALAQSPGDTRALVWKGTALTRLASGDTAKLEAARGHIVRANRLDPEASLPLIAWHDSFRAAGQPAPDIAVDGLFKVVQSAPAAPTLRLKLGEELVARDLGPTARTTLLPVARGPFDTPERPAAAALLDRAR